MEQERTNQSINAAEIMLQKFTSSLDVHQKNDFSEIELTDEEIADVLRAARSKKAARIREAAYWENVNKPKVYPVYTPDQMFDHAFAKGKAMITDFELDEKNKFIFTGLSFYFAGHPDCSKYGLSLEKGNIMVGPIGCGKTTIMRCFEQNPTNCFIEVSARKIAMEYSDKEIGGQNTIDRYSFVHQAIDKSKFWGQDKIGLFIDDIGTETNKKYFGNEMNVIENIILNRYDQISLKSKTHITTNLDANALEDMYGKRVRSRIRERFNWITFDPSSEDRRK